MSPETYIGSSRNVVEPTLADKLAAGTGGAELMLGMFDSVMGILEAHGAPDSVKQAAENFKQSILDWAKTLSEKPAEPSHDGQ